MPINLLSPNLNDIGDSGNFETDPSTWNFSYVFGTLARSNLSFKDTFSLEHTCIVNVTNPSFHRYAEARVPNVVVGKKYIVTAKILIPSSDKLFPDDNISLKIAGGFELTPFSTATSYIILEEINKTQQEAEDTWVEISKKIQVTGGATTFRPYIIHDPYTAAGGDPINNGGKIFIDEFEVYEFAEAPEIIVSIQTSDVTCFGQNNGSAQVTVSGGTPPFSYLWSDGGTTKDRTDLSAANHNITITDSLNDQKVLNVLISEPTQITIVATINGQNITLEVSGGTPGYTYAWSDGPTTKDRIGIPNGSYIVTVTDANGCTQQATIEVGTGGVAEDVLFYFTENPVLLELSADSPETKENLTFLCDLFVEKEYLSGSYEAVIRCEQPADNLGETIFDMQEMIKAFIPIDLPDLQQTEIVASNTFRRFYLAFTEKYGNPPVAQPFTQADVFYCLRGGINQREFAKQLFFSNYLVNNKPFLSWWPVQFKKPIYSGQAEFLYFLIINADTTELRLKLRVYYDDASQSDFSPYTNITNLNRYEVYRIPVSIEKLGLSNPAKPIDFYEVWVEDQNDSIISEVRLYQVEKDRSNYRQFLYENSLGAFDTLVSTGQAQGRIKVRTNEINKDLLPNAAVSDAQVEILSKSGSPERKLGAILKNSEAEHLIDFALSRRVFEVRKGFLVPVTIQSSPEYLNEVDNYNELQFSVFDEPVTNYTPEL
ncbi:MAG: SprB repeat-containing protein [Bacteroidota bacterium]